MRVGEASKESEGGGDPEGEGDGAALTARSKSRSMLTPTTGKRGKEEREREREGRGLTKEQGARCWRTTGMATDSQFTAGQRRRRMREEIQRGRATAPLRREEEDEGRVSKGARFISATEPTLSASGQAAERSSPPAC